VLDPGHSHNLSITESQLKAFRASPRPGSSSSARPGSRGSGSDNTGPMCGSIRTGPVPWRRERAPTD
jgi:hypothetical protein